MTTRVRYTFKVRLPEVATVADAEAVFAYMTSQRLNPVAGANYRDIQADKAFDIPYGAMRSDMLRAAIEDVIRGRGLPPGEVVVAPIEDTL